ncbi:unnamed protein product, partial [Meganyctiphanes norvegica]
SHCSFTMGNTANFWAAILVTAAQWARGWTFGNCPDLFTDVAGTCYYFSSDFPASATWNDALAACKKRGDGLGHINIGLAELGTSRDGCATPDIKLMETIANKGAQVWLGASDGREEGTWIWEESKEQLLISNNMWHHLAPNAGTEENCLAALIRTDIHNRPSLGDFPCTQNNSYVCQIF